MSSTFRVKSSELTVTTHKAQDIAYACGKQMTVPVVGLLMYQYQSMSGCGRPEPEPWRIQSGGA
jgi:hypothetical protein